MSRRPLSSLVAAALAVAAVAAPSALARPIVDSPAAPSKSTVASQDRRSPDAKDRAESAVQARGTNVAAPDQQVHSGPFSRVPESSSLAGRTSAGPPTWPADPKPITASQPTPADDGGGNVLPAALLILAAACVAMFAGMRFVRPRLRASRA
jgi:hypothetical protein